MAVAIVSSTTVSRWTDEPNPSLRTCHRTPLNSSEQSRRCKNACLSPATHPQPTFHHGRPHVPSCTFRRNQTPTTSHHGTLFRDTKRHTSHARRACFQQERASHSAIPPRKIHHMSKSSSCSCPRWLSPPSNGEVPGEAETGRDDIIAICWLWLCRGEDPPPVSGNKDDDDSAPPPPLPMARFGTPAVIDCPCSCSGTIFTEGWQRVREGSLERPCGTAWSRVAKPPCFMGRVGRGKGLRIRVDVW